MVFFLSVVLFLFYTGFVWERARDQSLIAGAVTYMGLATGALLWGCMADRVGRRRTLLTAVTLAAVFDLMAAIMPTFGTFLTARLIGGIG